MGFRSCIFSFSVVSSAHRKLTVRHTEEVVVKVAMKFKGVSKTKVLLSYISTLGEALFL